MKSLVKLTTIAGVLALCAFSYDANAQVSISSQCTFSGSGSTTCLPSSPANAPAAYSSTGNYQPNLTSSVPNQVLSPYANTPDNGDAYSALVDTNAGSTVNSSATYVGSGSTGFQILWG